MEIVAVVLRVCASLRMRRKLGKRKVAGLHADSNADTCISDGNQRTDSDENEDGWLEAMRPVE
jgi:hypothetical protein